MGVAVGCLRLSWVRETSMVRASPAPWEPGWGEQGVLGRIGDWWNQPEQGSRVPGSRFLTMRQKKQILERQKLNKYCDVGLDVSSDVASRLSRCRKVVCMCISQLCPLWGPDSSEIFMLIRLSFYTGFLTNRNQSSSEKTAIPGPRQGLRKNENTSEEHRSQFQEASTYQTEINLSMKILPLIVFHLLSKIEIYGPLLISVNKRVNRMEWISCLPYNTN